MPKPMNETDLFDDTSCLIDIINDNTSNGLDLDSVAEGGEAERRLCGIDIMVWVPEDAPMKCGAADFCIQLQKGDVGAQILININENEAEYAAYFDSKSSSWEPEVDKASIAYRKLSQTIYKKYD